MDSNISFSSNVNIIRSKSQSKGDEKFLRKVRDYDALCKLRTGPCHGSMNSNFYIFSYDQMKIVSPDFNMMYVAPQRDPAVLAENERLNKVYGYSQYDEKELAPLLDETYLEYGRSIWQNSGEFFWDNPGYYNDGYSGGIGTWAETNHQQGTVELYGGGSLFTTYIKQEMQKVAQSKDLFVPTETAEFPELQEVDPYYWVYQKTAGVESEEPTSKFSNKEAAAYLQKYGIYAAFEATEQETIITAPVSANIFVDAGPGTGKTYTLIQKINYMVEELEVDPEGILVLCFTNAAVAEIKNRRDEYIKNGGSRGLRKVDIRTFHSFAWWLIGEINENFTDEDGWKQVDMKTLSYDGSIVKATSIIRKYSEQVLSGWEHFIVDEIQDLTDVRARLVLQIIVSCLEVGCGFTVLGDSCQAIYDYNQDDVIDPMDSKKFYRLLFTLLYGKAKFYKLELNHRQTDSLISMTTGLREAILREKMSEMKAEVKNLQSRMKHAAGSSIAGSVSEEYLSKIAGDGDICLLCRNNGQVLRLSAILRKRGVNHIVNAYEHNRCFGAWVGSVFSNFNKAMINEEEFEDLYNDCGILSPYSAQEVWDRAAGMLGKPDNFRLGTNELLRAVYMSQLDDPVFHNQHQSNIIVSNIHKAKGREYNAVIVEERFIDGLVRRKKDIGEYKTLYVAVTRPKTQLYSANMVSGDGVRIWNIWKTGRKRWIKLVNGVLKFLEVRGNTDIDVNSFNMFGNDVQEYIAHNVQTGDEIILRKSKANEIFRYDIVHIKDEIETVIGRCTHLLDDDIEALLDTDDSFQWPAEVRELYVTDVYTHIGDQITETESALGKGNVWNWVDFCGLGRLVYDVY